MKTLWKIGIFCILCALNAGCGRDFDMLVGPGGYVFYDKGSYSDGWRYIECAKDAFKKDLPSYSGDFPAAKAEAEQMCKDYASGGHSDWYLPSETEARQMLKLWNDGKDPKLSKETEHSYSHYYWTTTGAVTNTGGTPKKVSSSSERYYVRPVRRF